MKRLFTLAFILSISFLHSQGSFDNYPLSSDGWHTIDSGITITEENTTKTEGTASASVEVTTTDQAKTDLRSYMDVVSGESYDVCFDIYHTEGNLQARIYANANYRNYSDNSVTGSWQSLCYSFIATSSTTLEVGLRFYDQSGFDGSEIVYVDNLTINGSVLPTIVFNYNLRLENNNSIINWQTSSETNNSHFNIEWSRDGKEFSEIGRVEGHGTTRDVQNYSFIHENPAPGNNYYRLTQVDFDGRKESFPVKSVYFDSKSRDFNIIPTLVADMVKVEFDNPVENGRILIYDMNGQMVKSCILAEGIDVFRTDISELTPGQYIMKYVDNQQTSSKKFVKQ